MHTFNDVINMLKIRSKLQICLSMEITIKLLDIDPFIRIKKERVLVFGSLWLMDRIIEVIFFLENNFILRAPLI